MYRVFAIFALLFATPVVAQWTVNTYAGGAAPFKPGDASSVSLGLALNPEGSVYVSTTNTIWRVRAGGVTQRFAGTGVSGYGGDGGPATAALLDGAFNLDPGVDAAGNVYFLDQNNYRIRRVDPSGTITTVAGTGVPWVAGMDREGPATLRSLPKAMSGFTVKSSGEIYFVDQSQIRRVTTTGQLQVVAGVLDSCTGCSDGDSVPAVLAHLKGASRIVFDNRDNLYVLEQVKLSPLSNFSQSSTIRRISPDGLMTRIAGCPMLPCGPGGDGQPALNQNFSLILALAADDSGNIYLSNAPPIYIGPYFVQRIAPDGLTQTIASVANSTTTYDLQNLYMDSAGRIVYRIGNTLYDVRNGSATTIIPRDVSVFVSTPDGTPAKDVQLPSSYFMAVSHAGELHYTDGCGVRRFDRDGILRTAASWCEGLVYYMASIAFDSQDRLWVRALGSGANHYSTFIVLPGGQILEQNLPQYFGDEWTIAVDSRDRLYRMTRSVLNRVEADGSVRQLGPPTNSSSKFFVAIGTDLQGNVFFAHRDSGFTSVYLANDDGSFTKFFEDRLETLGLQSDAPNLFVDAAGRMWGGLNFITQTGTFSPGLRASCQPGGSFASPEGTPVQSTRFCHIQQSVQAPDGSVYLAEGSRIHKLSPILRAATPVISTGGIVHSASYSGGPIAPGQLVSIFGFNFGPAVGGVEVAQAVNNMLQPALGRTKVMFVRPSGFLTEGAITAVTPTQINVFVPYDSLPSGATTAFVDIVVLVDDAPSLPMRMPVVQQAFDLFTSDLSGSGQGAIFNQDWSLNGPASPAPRGSIVSLWGAGAGRLFPELPDGALVISTPYPKPNVPVTVRIGGASAEVLYAGAAPTLPNGAFQINVRIPEFTAPGNASISVSIGSTTSTRNVTVAVQ